MRSSQTKKRNIIIGALCGVLLLMVVGYAAFSTMLNINGTSKISSNWNIHFDTTRTTETNGVIVGSAGLTGGQKPTGTVTYEGNLTANVTADLIQPGDTVEYHLVVVNDGTIDAKVEKITPADLTTQKGSVIFTRSEELNVGDVIKAGESKPITVTIKYDSSVTSQLEKETVEFTLSLDFVQDTDSSTPDGPGADIMGGTTVDMKGVDVELVTSGDGLYADEYETGKYVYKGANPDNYITFNNELWRIIAVQSDDTLKIIRNESIGKNAWDFKGTRNSSTSTFCKQASTNGCNAWAATTNLINTPSVFTMHYPNGNPNTDSTTSSGTVTQDSSLNTYLNTTYLGTINDDSKYIVNHNFNVGTPGNSSDTEDIATDAVQEALYKWNGKIGLMTITELLKATTNTTCTSLKEGYGSGSTGYCNTNNWMWPKSEHLWTISPYAISSSSFVHYASSYGYLNSVNAGNNIDQSVRPVVNLTSDIQLDGEGTLDVPYMIIG